MFTYIHYTSFTHVKNYNCSTFDSRKEFSKQCTGTSMPTNNQEEDNYVIQQPPKHSALHTKVGGWGHCLLIWEIAL